MPTKKRILRRKPRKNTFKLPFVGGFSIGSLSTTGNRDNLSNLLNGYSRDSADATKNSEIEAAMNKLSSLDGVKNITPSLPSSVILAFVKKYNALKTPILGEQLTKQTMEYFNSTVTDFKEDDIKLIFDSTTRVDKSLLKDVLIKVKSSTIYNTQKDLIDKYLNELFVQEFDAAVNAYTNEKDGEILALLDQNIDLNESRIVSKLPLFSEPVLSKLLNKAATLKMGPLSLKIKQAITEKKKTALNVPTNASPQPSSQTDFSTEIALLEEADINKIDEMGNTILHRICLTGTKDDFTALKSNFPNVDLNIENAEGMTPLMMSAKRGILDIVASLLADDGITNAPSTKTGKTALHYACENPVLDVINALTNEKEEDYISKPDNNGFTPLLIACRAETPIDDAFVSLPDIVGRLTPLVIKSKEKNVINAVDLSGHNCLFHIAKYAMDMVGTDNDGGRFDKIKPIMDLLISNGVDLTHPNNEGETLLYIACNRGIEKGPNPSLIQYLVDTVDISVDANSLTILSTNKEEINKIIQNAAVFQSKPAREKNIIRNNMNNYTKVIAIFEEEKKNNESIGATTSAPVAKPSGLFGMFSAGGKRTRSIRKFRGGKSHSSKAKRRLMR